MVTTTETDILAERILKALVDEIPGLPAREYEKAANAVARVLRDEHEIAENMKDFWKCRADGAE